MTKGYGRREHLAEVDVALLLADPSRSIIRTSVASVRARLFDRIAAMTRAAEACPATREAVLEQDAINPGDGCPLCGGPPALHQPEAPMTEPIPQFCVCSEGGCYCTETTSMPLDEAASGGEWECPACASGHHVWAPGGERS